MGESQKVTLVSLCNTCAAINCDARKTGIVVAECKYYVKDIEKTGEWVKVVHF